MAKKKSGGKPQQRPISAFWATRQLASQRASELIPEIAPDDLPADFPAALVPTVPGRRLKWTIREGFTGGAQYVPAYFDDAVDDALVARGWTSARSEVGLWDQGDFWMFDAWKQGDWEAENIPTAWLTAGGVMVRCPNADWVPTNLTYESFEALLEEIDELETLGIHPDDFYGDE